MESNDAGARSSERAQELRASLGARRELEALLAEASATRQAAAAQADELIEEAQVVSQQLVAETRADAERLLAAARAEADDITRQARSAAAEVRARAEADVEEHRRRLRAEVTEQVTRDLEERSRAALTRQHEQQQAMIGDLEASVRILGVSLDSAAANVGEMLGALDDLRLHGVESLGEYDEPTAPPAPVTPAPREERRTRPSIPAVDELFRSTAATREEAEPPAPPAPPAPTQQPVEAPAASGEAPLSATEAFLLSAHVDHGDPPLPPMDDEEIGARYARDAMRATARARSRQDPETLGVAPERPSQVRRGPDERGERGERDDERSAEAPPASDGADPAGKPLGWLFRSS